MPSGSGAELDLHRGAAHRSEDLLLLAGEPAQKTKELYDAIAAS